MRDKTVCFTGHRYISPSEKKKIEPWLEALLEKLIGEGYLYFGAGGAIGFDTLAAKTVLRLRKKHPDIKLILVLPCKSQIMGWKMKDIIVYERIKKQADKVVYTSESYDTGCMFKRNRHLVDHSSVCICYLVAASGGTAYTVEYATQNGLRVINLAACPDPSCLAQIRS
jgi:uncharacterized phage-like protein YoqJ